MSEAHTDWTDVAGARSRERGRRRCEARKQQPAEHFASTLAALRGRSEA